MPDILQDLPINAAAAAMLLAAAPAGQEAVRRRYPAPAKP